MKHPFDANRSGFLEPKLIPKPWGGERWLVHTPDYGMKFLDIKRGHRLSIQYHPRKRETLVLLSGDVQVLLGRQGERSHRGAVWHTMVPGLPVHLEPDTVHSFRAITDACLAEVSTPHLAVEDTVRLEDPYGRRADQR
jgi:mannose-6-phosphate isomerase